MFLQGDSLLLDDGKLRMTVVDSGEGYVNCMVDVGGKLSNKKGVNTPSVRLPISAMTPKVRATVFRKAASRQRSFSSGGNRMDEPTKHVFLEARKNTA